MKKTNKLVTKAVGSFEGSEAAGYEVVEVTTTRDSLVREYRLEEIDLKIAACEEVAAKNQAELDELNGYKALFTK